MKSSIPKMALVAALSICLSNAQAQSHASDNGDRCCGKPKPKPKPKGALVEDCSSCSDQTKGCPCNKPRPKPKSKPKGAIAQEAESCDVDTTKGCPCNKPKPKPKPLVNKDAVVKSIENFRSADPELQPQALAWHVENYVQHPSTDTALTVMGCAKEYCRRVQNQELNELVKQLIAANDKEVVQEAIFHALA